MNWEAVMGGGSRQEKRKFSKKFSKLDALLGADAGVEWVLDFGHLGHQVSSFDQRGWRVATGHDYMQGRLRTADAANFFQDFLDRKQTITQDIHQLIKYQ